MSETEAPINLNRFEVKNLIRRVDSQDLNAAALSSLTTFDRRWRLLRIMIAFDVACSQTLTITFKSKDGTTYDTIIFTQALDAVLDVYIQGEATDIFWKGDELLIEITTGGASTAYLTILGEEIA